MTGVLAFLVVLFGWGFFVVCLVWFWFWFGVWGVCVCVWWFFVLFFLN